ERRAERGPHFLAGVAGGDGHGEHRPEGVPVGAHVAGHGDLRGAADGFGCFGELFFVHYISSGWGPSVAMRRRMLSIRSPWTTPESRANSRCGVYFIRTWRPTADCSRGAALVRAATASSPRLRSSDEMMTTARRRSGIVSTVVTDTNSTLVSVRRSISSVTSSLRIEFTFRIRRVAIRAPPGRRRPV